MGPALVAKVSGSIQCSLVYPLMCSRGGNVFKASLKAPHVVGTVPKLSTCSWFLLLAFPCLRYTGDLTTGRKGSQEDSADPFFCLWCCVQHMLPLLAANGGSGNMGGRPVAVLASLSARVSSIGDNKLGGGTRTALPRRLSTSVRHPASLAPLARSTHACAVPLALACHLCCCSRQLLLHPYESHTLTEQVDLSVQQ